MAISLYDVSVTPFLQTLGGVAGFLEKGRIHCETKGMDPGEIVETRLYPDMQPFRFQIISVAHHSRGALEAVRTGTATPPGPSSDLDYAALMQRVAEAQQALQALSRETVDGWLGKDVTFTLGERRLPFTAEGFLMSFALPNLHFHATTAYDILRMKGVPLGKRDYLGSLAMKR